MYDFWYDYIKLKYDEEATICYMDADVSLYTSKQMIFIKILLKMLKLDLMLQIMNQNVIPLTGYYQKEKKKKVIELMKDELDGGLRAKTYSYLINDNSEDKKAKSTKTCVKKRKLKFENHKRCLEATQLENIINHLEKRKIDTDNIKENHKKF